jgi:hypothetical protein
MAPAAYMMASSQTPHHIEKYLYESKLALCFLLFIMKMKMVVRLINESGGENRYTKPIHNTCTGQLQPT